MNTFFALTPCWFSLDRFYKVYVHDNALFGAFLAKQVYDEFSAHTQMLAPAQVFAPVMKIWADKILLRRKEREEKHDTSDFSRKDFLAENKHNFILPKNEIRKVSITPKRRTYWTGGSEISGILTLTGKNDTKSRYILPGIQDVEAITQMLNQ